MPGSALVLDDAIGPYRDALADLLGCSRDSLDLACLPAPDFTAAGRSNRGRRNCLDEIVLIARHCPHGLSALAWAADQVGYRLLPKATTPHDGKLLVEPSMLAAAVDALLAELNRRKPKMQATQVEQLRDAIIDDLCGLVADRLAHRKA